LQTATFSSKQGGKRPLTVSCQYPVLTGGSGASSYATINGAMQSVPTGEATTFEKNVNLGPVATNKWGPSVNSFTCSWSTAELSPTFGSAVVTAVAYPAGAAQPFHEISTFDFDPATGQMDTLADLFKSGSDWLGVLSSESRALLGAEFGATPSQPVYQAGTSPKAANFAAWSLSGANLDITFQESQVGPYSFGTPTIHIPLSALAAVADPSGPLGG
jgi:Protein of unknown function (DUF3298)